MTYNIRMTFYFAAGGFACHEGDYFGETMREALDMAKTDFIEAMAKDGTIEVDYCVPAY